MLLPRAPLDTQAMIAARLSPDGGAGYRGGFEIARFLDAHLFAKKVENVAQVTLFITG